MLHDWHILLFVLNVTHLCLVKIVERMVVSKLRDTETQKHRNSFVPALYILPPFSQIYPLYYILYYIYIYIYNIKLVARVEN